MSIKVNGKNIAVTTPFDPAVVDLVSGLNKQKQVLAQALNDKGVNVTPSDTLDKMAAEIKDLDVLGAQDKVVCEFYSPFNTGTGSLYSRISSAQARVLREHNAIISRTSAGVFGIFKLAAGGSLVEIASCDCNDFVPTSSANSYCGFGFSQNEEHLAWYDGKLQKLILLHMDWETNTLTRTLAYTVTTANVGTVGKTESMTSNGYYLLGVAPASDGSKVCILSSGQNKYIHATVVDVATQTEVTNLGNTANAVGNMTSSSIFWGFWLWDIETGIIKGGTSYYPLFKFTLDLSGDIPLMSFVEYSISRAGNYSSSYYGMPYFLWDKGLMLQLASSGSKTCYDYKPSGIYGTLWLRDIETGSILDSAGIEIDRLLRANNSNTSSSAGVGSHTSNSSSYTPVVVKKDGKIIVGFGMYMRFELDEENKKLIPYKHNGAKDANGRYVCFPVQPSPSVNHYFPPNYIYCEENPDLIFAAIQEAENYGEWVTGSNVIWTREEPCVLGLFLNRNGKRTLMYDIFDYTQYKNGAYTEKDEVAIVDVES